MAQSAGVWGKIGGAGIGLAIGGPIGALLGALAGHLLVDRVGAPFGPTPKDLVFTMGLVALAAKMAKSDGVVVDAEVAAFESLIKVPEGEHETVRRLFDLAKATPTGFEGYARQIAETFADEPELREDVMDGLFHIAKADRAIHENEEAYLRRVAELLGFDEADYARIAARHVRLPEDPYLVLGAERAWSDDALKRRWRELVQENHPDRAIAHGLPEEAVAIATRRLAAINDAWGRIARERRL